MASAARRQSSSTSLSKYARAHSPDFADHSYDFCNAFWGLGDVGVDVLFARLRGAMRTTEELRNFWKERAALEDQYAKRLTALAKLTLGRDEIGDLRSSLDSIRLETEKQASFHSKLAVQIKEELEGGSTIFLNKQTQHKRQVQAQIEKEFKTKQQQEAHVQRAREKYEADCVRINSYTAQSTLIQGKDLERVQQKLRSAQQTVAANEREFAQFARELQATTGKWEMRWKDFCDRSQDLEEERLEFMKDHMWGYANAISTVCVADDESCERMRLALEQMEPEKDMENFVRDYGTGDGMPDPPAFVNYTDPNSVPSSVSRPTTHAARFERTTRRVRQTMPPPPDAQEDDNAPVENMVGIGAGGGRSGDAPMSRSRSASRASVRNQAPPPDRSAAPPVPSQVQGPITTNGHGPAAVNGGTSPVKVGQEGDPLVMQLNELQRGIGSVRRSPVAAMAGSGASQRQPSPAPSPGQGQRQPGQTHQQKESASQLAPPPGSRGGGPPDRNPDYRRSAEIVVGSFPPNISSRPTSPNQPMPVMAMRPSNSLPDNNMVQNVLNDYQQSFPGERKSVSRPGSRASSINGPAPGQQQPQARTGRPESMAGVGAQGRSPSPQPFIPPSRDTSPMQPKSVSPSGQPWSAAPPRAPSPYQSPPQAAQPPPPAITPAQQVQAQAQAQAQGRGAAMRVPPPGAVATAINGAHIPRQNSMSVPQAQPVRAASPNRIGIALDPSGRVAMDAMALEYLERQQQVQGQYRGPMQPPVQQPPPPQRQPSYTQVQVPPQPPQQMYVPPPPPAAAPIYNGYQQPPQQAPPIAQPPPQAAYGQQPPYGQYGSQLQRANTGYYNPPPQQQQQQQQPYRAVSPAPPPQSQRAPQTAAPAAGYTDDGRPILFYVKALYDYDAVIGEEFDFQSGDIIAVTATPEDGWWSGELLDEQRRQPGRHVFPSNFVDLLQ